MYDAFSARFRATALDEERWKFPPFFGHKKRVFFLVIFRILRGTLSFHCLLPRLSSLIVRYIVFLHKVSVY